MDTKIENIIVTMRKLLSSIAKEQETLKVTFDLNFKRGELCNTQVTTKTDLKK